MDTAQFDDFLNDACFDLHDLWMENGGAEITPERLQALNDLLDEFFSTERKRIENTD